jgi:hypothetical protein
MSMPPSQPALASQVHQADLARLTAALCMAGAGLMHLLILPEHFEHAPAHGWFFAAAGVAQIGWAAVGWRPGRAWVDILGLVLAGSLIVLWGITRVFPAPFSATPEEIDGAGLIAKALEAGAFAAISVSLARGRQVRALMLASAIAVAAAGLFHAGGRLAGPYFPSLWVEEAEAGAADVGVHTHVSGQRVRLNDVSAGPWVVRVLTSPVPPRPGNFLVEVRVRDAATGRTRQDADVWIEARPEEGSANAIRVEGQPELAKIPGELAAQVPVDRPGIWLITVSVDGPEGQGQVGFAERVSNALGLGAWLSALLPFAGLALLVLGYAALSRASGDG